MTRTIFFIILSILLLTSFNKIRSSKAVPVQKDCEASWVYFSLTDTVRGRVLFHSKAPFFCGVLATASLTVIKTNKSDTIRVLCNTDVVFKKSATVKIFPYKKPDFGVVLPVNKNQYNCTIKNTCYGIISSTE